MMSDPTGGRILWEMKTTGKKQITIKVSDRRACGRPPSCRTDPVSASSWVDATTSFMRRMTPVHRLSLT
jgi:hypothetical protein